MCLSLCKEGGDFMSTEKKFKICTRRYIKDEAGKTIDIPEGYHNVEELFCTEKTSYFTFNEGEEDYYGVFCLDNSIIRVVIPAGYEQSARQCLIDDKYYILLPKGYYSSENIYPSEEIYYHYQLWDPETEKLIHGGRLYSHIYSNITYNGVLHVQTRRGSSFSDNQALVDFKTGEILWEGDLITNLLRGSERFYRVGFSLFDTLSRKFILSSELGEAEYTYMGNFILVNYADSSKVFTRDGVMILSDLSKNTKLVSDSQSIQDLIVTRFNQDYSYYQLVEITDPSCVVVASFRSSGSHRDGMPYEYCFGVYNYYTGEKLDRPLTEYEMDKIQHAIYQNFAIIMDKLIRSKGGGKSIF